MAGAIAPPAGGSYAAAYRRGAASPSASSASNKAPAPTARLARRDSFDELLIHWTGQPPVRSRAVGNTRCVRVQPAAWLSLKPALLWGTDQLFFRTDLLLGEGTSGKVHLGIAVGTGELVALKRSARNGEGDAENACYTGALMAKRGSPIAPHAVLQTSGAVYSVESLMSCDLHEKRWAFDLSSGERCGIAWLAARGVLPTLIHLHAAGLAHRDIKPGNIMQRSTRAQLIDYNLAGGVTCPEYITTERYAPPECEDHTHARAGLDKLDRWCLGASLLQLAGDDAAQRLLHRHKDDFPTGRWHPLYAGLYPQLLSGKLGKRLLTPGQSVVWAAFASVAPPMRQLILGLMHPQPSQRLDLGVAQRRLEKSDMLEACDMGGAREVLRQRAQERARQFEPVVALAKQDLQEQASLVAQKLGGLPHWLRPSRSSTDFIDTAGSGLLASAAHPLGPGF